MTNLNNEKITADTTLDSIVIKHYIFGIEGGRSLDVTGFDPKTISAGHIVIKSNDDIYKPMPISGDVYAALPANHSYVGVVVASILTSKPMAGIMTQGTVNEEASPYPVTTGIKAALTHITFTKD